MGGFEMLDVAGAALALTCAVVGFPDGSFVGVQPDKPSYYSGEIITGRVVAHIVTPKMIDKILVKFTAKEKVKWTDERSETIWEGEGQNRKSRTVYHRHEHKADKTILKEVLIVDGSPKMMMPGTYQYPFVLPLPAALPNVMKFEHSYRSSDPHYGKPLVTKAEVMFTAKAKIDVAGVLSKDVKSRQELVVNHAILAAKLAPAHAENHGQVRLCCCIPRGMVHLVCDFPKSAYMGGETAMATAAITNDSKSNVRKMVVKLVRSIMLSDGRGNIKHMYDTMCKAHYEGVQAFNSATRQMQLLLADKRGMPFLPTVGGVLIRVAYDLVCECDVPFAPDITVTLPVDIYVPPPVIFGLQAAFGGALPQGFIMPAPPAAMQQPMPMQQMPPLPAAMAPAGTPTTTNPIVHVQMAQSAESSPQGPMPSAPYSPSTATVVPVPAPSAPM